MTTTSTPPSLADLAREAAEHEASAERQKQYDEARQRWASLLDAGRKAVKYLTGRDPDAEAGPEPVLGQAYYPEHRGFYYRVDGIWFAYANDSRQKGWTLRLGTAYCLGGDSGYCHTEPALTSLADLGRQLVLTVDGIPIPGYTSHYHYTPETDHIIDSGGLAQDDRYWQGKVEHAVPSGKLPNGRAPQPYAGHAE